MMIVSDKDTNYREHRAKKRPTPTLKKVIYIYDMCVLALVPDVAPE